ncbi:DUF2927 domain-containing protein [uncultured Cohaesibacter sp.]|uniref:DUF2927 domain-containing protein n=1 Tax=uncultured Cohaesibacter sp. TaxID=1002546 RepID=UPI0029C8EF8C|nr:DUF2927 domain-containing protein [uncultured Cohaesibacter sp.]
MQQTSHIPPMKASRFSRLLARTRLLTACGLLLSGFVLMPPPAQALRYDDKEVTEGFYKTVFGAEIGALSWGDQSRRVKKYVSPVRVWIHNRAKLNRLNSVRNFVMGLPAIIPGLQLRMANNYKDANFHIYVVDSADYVRTVQDEVYNNRSMDVPGQCIVRVLSRRSGILRSDAVIVSDQGGSVFHRCMVEEILQGLGPVNDDKSLVHSVFNDESTFDYFTQFDRLILNMLYSPDLRPGMTLKQVKPMAPKLLHYARKTTGLH